MTSPLLQIPSNLKKTSLKLLKHFFVVAFTAIFKQLEPQLVINESVIMKKSLVLVLCMLFLSTSAVFSQSIDMENLKGIKPRNIGPAGMSGRVTSIDVVLSDTKIMYAGTASGGLWKSTSGGTTWEPIFDKKNAASIGVVKVQQSNPSVIWVGTGEGNPRNSQSMGRGIFKSIDAGKTWTYMGLAETKTIHRLLIDPTNPDIVYVGAFGNAWADSEERGLYKTTDGGKTWKKILYANTRTGVGDMVMDPTNPNKLIVSLYEYRRWPWFFKSGGEGSGLHITYDGGENWKKITSEDGLPEGELGKIGLAMATNKPNVVYALVESKKNALYRSDDGGHKWRKINDNGDIGDRPFYYGDIYVDPSNEQRIYTLYSRVGMSEDGGKSFRVILPYWGVHPDHHAWWIHPTNPIFMIDGNDGGLNITYDGGVSWRFAENIPLAQFYHISVDNEWPYNVYGGMQDNGSWRGPAYVWQASGIRNGVWQELFFGDGFDVLPDPDDSRYGFAMSQGGNLGRYDHHTGYAKMVKPVHPDGIELRFNWNAPIAQDPFDNSTIYYGSQFVHKSTNKGDTWEIISPDLTTNNKEKQTYNKSGGLTYDVTAAENHTTVLAIAPSPLEKGVIWVGTDDGNVQLTRNGGETWENITKNIKGAPKEGWVPQIRASRFNKGEAYVVMNNYRQGDWSAYLFRTTNYGKKWERVVDDKKIDGWLWSFIQDTEEPKLLFAGSEFGLYFSIDEGKNWTKWNEGFPTVAVSDLAIQEREADLVIGTFGRAAWVIDNIRPLRELARTSGKVAQNEVTVFQPTTAVLAEYKQPPGIRFDADAMFEGANRPFGAEITYSVKTGSNKLAKADSTKKGTKAKIEILEGNEVIRTLKQVPETGMNRIVWELDYKGLPNPNARQRPDADEPGGLQVLPGTYKVRVSYNGAVDSTQVKVVFDPRINVSMEHLKARLAKQREVESLREVMNEAIKQLNDSKETLDILAKQWPKSGVDSLKKTAKSLSDSLTTLRELFLPKEDVQGIFRSQDIISAKVGAPNRYLGSAIDGISETHEILIREAKKALDSGLERVNLFFTRTWKPFEEQVKAQQVSPFKEWKEIK